AARAGLHRAPAGADARKSHAGRPPAGCVLSDDFQEDCRLWFEPHREARRHFRLMTSPGRPFAALPSVAATRALGDVTLAHSHSTGRFKQIAAIERILRSDSHIL